MNATQEQLGDLLELQAVSIRRAQAKKEFDELPQRQAILQLRQKREEITKKQEQVQTLLKQAQAEVTKISDEDERLAEKQRTKQAEIESGSGNFRAVESLSKELNALSKQRAGLSAKSDAAIAQLGKVKGLAQQIETALKALDEKEAGEVDSFKQQGTALQKEIAQLDAEAAELLAALPSDIAEEFKKLVQSKGVAVGKFANGRCGCCRSQIDSAHLGALKAQAPLGVCPFCKRMLVL